MGRKQTPRKFEDDVAVLHSEAACVHCGAKITCEVHTNVMLPKTIAMLTALADGGPITLSEATEAQLEEELQKWGVEVLSRLLTVELGAATKAQRIPRHKAVHTVECPACRGSLNALLILEKRAAKPILRFLEAVSGLFTGLPGPTPLHQAFAMTVRRAAAADEHSPPNEPFETRQQLLERLERQGLLSRPHANASKHELDDQGEN